MLEELTFNLNPIDWAGISGIADTLLVILNIVLIASLIIGYRGIKEAVITRNADMLVWSIAQMEEIKPDLRILLSAPKFKLEHDYEGEPIASNWSDDAKLAAYRVSTRLQRLSYLALAGMISQEHLIGMWGPTFVLSWAKLEPWVKELRHKNGEPYELSDGAFSRKDLEVFANECASYHGQTLVDGRPTIVELEFATDSTPSQGYL